MTTICLYAGATYWTVPTDFQAAGATIECVGCGGNGANGVVGNSGGGGGQGGGYAKVTSPAHIRPNDILALSVGHLGTVSSLKDNTGTIICQADYGRSATTNAGGSGTQNNIGDVTFAGGNGGDGGSTSSSSGGGGGGAAGPSGAGKAGGTPVAGGGGAGGGGANGGSSTVGLANIGTTGGAGGQGTSGAGSGVGGSSGNSGGVGTLGGGGGGAGQNAGVTNFGGAGGGDIFSPNHGAGGGGGGGGSGTASNASGGGVGGHYGGGGGGGGNSAGNAGNGGNGYDGVVIINYTPVPPPRWKKVDRARETTPTTGTGPLTLGPPATAYRTFAAAGVVDGDNLEYLIEDSTSWEIGIGTYASAGPTLTRTLRSSSTGSLLNLSGKAFVTVIPTSSTFLPMIGGTLHDTLQVTAAPGGWSSESYAKNLLLGGCAERSALAWLPSDTSTNIFAIASYNGGLVFCLMPPLNDSTSPSINLWEIYTNPNVMELLMDLSFEDSSLYLDHDPVSGLEAATKNYVDTAISIGGQFLPLTGGTLTGALVLAADPATPFGAATQQYVDTQVSNAIGASGASALLVYYNARTNNILETDPGSGNMEWNTTIQWDAVQLYVSKTSNIGNDLTAIWNASIGARVAVQKKNDSTVIARYTLNSIVDHNGWLTLNVTPISSSGLPFGPNTALLVAIVTSAALLPLAGGTMTGNLILAADPTIPLMAATKQYVDNGFLPISGGALTGNLLLPPGTGAAPSLSFSNDTTTGLFWAASNLRFVVSGVVAFRLASTYFATFVQVRSGYDGTPDAPAYSFNTETNSGLYHKGAGTLSMSMQSNDVMSWAATGKVTTAFGPVVLPVDPVNPLEAATKQYVDARAWKEAPVDSNAYLRTNNTWSSGGTVAHNLAIGSGIIPGAASDGNIFIGRSMVGIAEVSSITFGAYFDTVSAWRYLGNTAAMAYSVFNGKFSFYTAPVGIQNNVVPFTLCFTVEPGIFTMSPGTSLVLSTDPTTGLQAATKQYVDNKFAAGVISFNTRTGTVVLNSTDVTTALGFTPYNSTNPSGYQTSSQVITALAAGSPGAFSTLSASGTVSGAGFTALLSPYALTSSVPVASSTTPVMDGTATIGVGTTWARSDHIHATDTSRYAASNPSGYQTSAQVVTALAAGSPGAFSTLSASGTVSGAGFTSYLASPPAIGATVANTGAFTTLTASSTVSGAGFTTLLSPYALTSSVPVASSTTPVMDSAAAIGVGTTWARSDHVHPVDTSRYAASNPSGYQTAAQVTTALAAGSPGAFSTLSASSTVSGAGFTTLLSPYALLASPTFSGTPSLPTGTVGVTQIAGTNNTSLATTAFVTAAITAANAGVSSFNTRTGAVVLNSADVTTALGFTPYNSTNPSGYQTSAQVVTALAAGSPGAFSTLSASGTVSGAGFTTLLSPYALLTTRLDQFAAPNVDVGWNSHRITGLLDPSQAQDAATKNYVDSVAQGIVGKAAVRVATTGANITLSGTQTIDGVAVIVGDRVLVKDQTSQPTNGIYVVAAGAWARATDTDTWNELVSAYTFVSQGTINADNGFLCTVDQGGTLGTTSVTWVQFSGAGQILAGGGLTKTGNQLDVVGTAARIAVFADNIDIDSSYVGQASITTLGTVATGTWNATTIGVAKGGTGATTLTGYVKGSGISAFTASATIPNTDITGLGTMATQNASAVAITGGTLNSVSVGATTASTGAFTTLSASGAATFGVSAQNILTLTPGAASSNPVTISLSGAGAGIKINTHLDFDASPTSQQYTTYFSSGSKRWQMGTANGEAAGNIGSDWCWYRYDNTGSYLDTPVTIVRSSGALLVGPLADSGYKLDVTGTARATSVTLAADPTLALQAATKQYVDLRAPLASPVFTGTPSLPTGTIGITQIAGTNNTSLATTAFVTAAISAANAGVSSFNTRTGAVVLNSTDVTTALGFTPYNATNPSGYQTAAQVTTSLGAYLSLAGGTLSGGISFGGSIAGSQTDLSRHIQLHNAGYGFAITAATLNYVSGGTHQFLSGGALTLNITAAGLNMGAATDILLVRDPTTALQAATKQYADKMLPLAGGALTGALTITYVPTATTAQLFIQPVGNALALESKLRFGGTFHDGTADIGVRLTTSLRSGFSAGAWGSEYLDVWINNGGQNDTVSDANQKQLARFTNAGLTMMANTALTLAADPTSALQAATKQYVDNNTITPTAGDARWVNVTGDTMVGPLTLSNAISKASGLTITEGTNVGNFYYDKTGSGFLTIDINNYGGFLQFDDNEGYVNAPWVSYRTKYGFQIYSDSIGIYSSVAWWDSANNIGAGIGPKVYTTTGAGELIIGPANAWGMLSDNIWAHFYPSPASVTFFCASTFQSTVTLHADPTTALHAATKQYVDSKAGGSVTISDTAPVAPSTGAMWFDSVNAQLYIRYADSSSSQWVVANNVSGANAVTSFNARTGAVTLTTADVTTALGYTPVNKAGDTMTGTLSVLNALTVNAAAGQWSNINLQRAAGQATQIGGYTGLLARWTMTLGDATAESGSNAGSNFGLSRFTDAGAYIDTPIAINRATSAITLSGLTTITGGGRLILSSASYPRVSWYNSAAVADQKYVDAFVDAGGNFLIQFVNDAFALGNSFISATRSGYAVSALTLTAPTITLTGSVSGTGQWYTSGAILSNAGVYPGYSASTGFTLYMSGGSPQIRFSTDNWHLAWDNANGNLNYYNNGGGLLWQCSGGGVGFYSSSLNSPVITATNYMMNWSGIFYVANNTAYYMGRSGSDGAWRFVENGTTNLTIDTGGNVTARSGFYASYLRSYGTTQCDGVCNFSAGFTCSSYYGHTMEFGWDGSLVRVSIDRGGVTYQIPTQGDVSNRATWDWVNNNFKNIGAYTPNQNVDWGANPTFYTLSVNVALWVNANIIYFSSGGSSYIQYNGSAILFVAAYVDVHAPFHVYSDCTVDGDMHCSRIFTHAASGYDFAFWRYDTNGTCYIRCNGADYGPINYGSDARIKQDIAPSKLDCLDVVRRMPLHEFRYRPIENGVLADAAPDTPLVPIGFTTQSLGEVLPEAIQGPNVEPPEGGKMVVHSIDPNVVMATLAGSVQQLSAEVDALKAELASLKGQQISG